MLRYYAMLKLLLLPSILICTLSFGQNERFGIIKVNEINFQDKMIMGLGMFYANDLQSIAVSSKFFNPINGEISLNRIQFDYRQYIFRKQEIIQPFIAIGAEFFKDVNRMSNWAYYHPNTFNHCKPDGPENQPVYCWYESRTTETKLYLGIGLGTEIRFNRNLHMSIGLHTFYYKRNTSFDEIYYTSPLTMRSSGSGSQGIIRSIRFGLAYTFAGLTKSNKAKIK